MAVLVRVPVDERDVLGRDFDVAGARLDETAREQAALAEPAGVVLVERLLRLEREVERLRRRGPQQAIGRVERLHDRLALERAAVLVDRFLREQPLEQLAPAREALVPELLRRPHGRRGVLRIDDEERTVIRAEEAGGVERFQRADLPGAFDRLADRDKRRHVRVLRTERARDDRTDVRHRLRLGRNVARVPVVLVTRVQDEAEVRGREACG